MELSEDERRAAFDALVVAANLPPLRYLRRRIDPAAADDVLGDVLLVMWRRVDDIPDEAPLTWCYGVARGCLANALRGPNDSVDSSAGSPQAAGSAQQPGKECQLGKERRPGGHLDQRDGTEAPR